MRKYSTGSIRKRPRSKNSNEWEWQGVIYYTENNKNRQVTKMLNIPADPPKPTEQGRGRKTTPTGRGARQATQKLREWRQELIAQEAAQEAQASTTTQAGSKVCDYVERYWDTRDITPETREHYSYLLKHMKRPVLDIPMRDLTTATVREWLALLRDEGLGQSMLNKTYNQLMYACRYAVEEGVLDRNPCLKRDTPKRSKHEMNPLDEANVKTLKQVLDKMQDTDPKLADLADLALNTGMRIGELCALTLDDVDDRHIHVRNVIVRATGGCRLKDCPKNGDRRDIPQNDVTRAIVDRRRKALEHHTRHLGKASIYLFADITTPDKYPSPAYLGKAWSAAMKTAGVVGVAGVKPRFHDLRDTFATQALVNGIDVVTVAAILGHRDTSTTLRHYARWLPNANATAMGKMVDVLS